MVRINKTRFYAAVGLTTLGSFILAGCAQPEVKPAGTSPATSSTVPTATTDNTTTTTDKVATAPSTNSTTGTGASSTTSAKPFDDAANTMGRVEEARTEMDTAIDAKSSNQVHAADTKIRDTVGMLPDKSSALPDD